MNLRILAYCLLVIPFSQCNISPPHYGVYVEELDIWVDSSEVTSLNFEAFRTSYDVKIASDSSAASVFDSKTNLWTKNQEVDHLHPVSSLKTDSLAPAVHVSWDDACAYCNAKNGRLPTADEWETIADCDFIPGNIWEGFFPLKDEGKDGFKTEAAPVTSFKPDSRGLYDIHGNVWEWTLTEDGSGSYFIKGGSFLSDYNEGGFLPDFKKSLPHATLRNDLGFRCVYDSK